MNERNPDPPRVLHLFSNYKWTGPAEPALNLCVALRRRGVAADFACAPGPPGVHNKIVAEARARGVEPLLALRLSKHRHPWRNWRDQRSLARLLRERAYDLVHCHLPNDHYIAAGPAARAGLPLVRSNYDGEGLAPTRANHRAIARTALLIDPARAARRRDAAAFGLSAERTAVVPGAVDTQRFDPARELPDGRARLGIAPEDFVIGVVARMQTHRRYKTLFEALRKLVDAAPRARLVVVGRGTRQAEVGWQPAAALGLEAHVHFTGYLDGDDYAGMLRAFDAGVYLTPGSDGTCRAAREIMAMGVPMVVANRGLLPEIVHHGVDGLVFDGGAGALFEALRGLAENPGRREAMAQAAHETAATDYALDVQAKRVAALYARILGPR